VLRFVSSLLNQDWDWDHQRRSEA